MYVFPMILNLMPMSVCLWSPYHLTYTLITLLKQEGYTIVLIQLHEIFMMYLVH